ncbi:MAG: hypothetical protein NC344_00315 [Bacteroidales bacterium]|nr:hypothetical protein [Bacteroidales bacterium]MCM1146280.1 hypothetical protein [Bacteroidales bacterium]MCM1205282.1 hypothetical protein [Bacillota bacterium]MCM1509631.1 hypothetical protein [Clostridium sp.]
MTNSQPYLFATLMAAFIIFITSFSYTRKSRRKGSESIPTHSWKQENEDKEKIRKYLHGCRCTMVAPGLALGEIKNLWLEAQERGKREGFRPVQTETDASLFDIQSDEQEDREVSLLRNWREDPLGMTAKDGKVLLDERFKEMMGYIIEDNGKDFLDTEVAGSQQDAEPCNDLFVSGISLMLAEIPVEHS